MKNVIDAVNEFECHFPLHANKHLIVNPETEEIRVWRGVNISTDLNTSCWDILCDENQFNQCVDEMATNYGTSETYADYKANYTAINNDIQLAPVYTQEMHEAGEVASPGMEVNHFSKIMTVIAKPDADGYFPALKEKGTYTMVLATDCLPLNPIKTVIEKAFDNFLDYNYNSTKEDFSKSQPDRDFIEGLEIAFNAGATFTGES